MQFSVQPNYQNALYLSTERRVSTTTTGCQQFIETVLIVAAAIKLGIVATK